MTEKLQAIQAQMAAYQAEGGRVGSLSDGFHTYDELYDHRCVLFSIICRLFPDQAFRAHKHADGTMFEDMFVAGIETPAGQYTYHYFLKDWGRFDGIETLELAPTYDGHQPSDITRLYSLLGAADAAQG